MEITIARAAPADATLVGHLIQLYLYDLSELEPKELCDAGLFYYDGLDTLLSDRRRHTFVVRVEGRPAGIAVAQRGFFHERDGAIDDELVEMVDFFVVRRHRRRGVGTALARHCFRAVGGRWQVRADGHNPAACRFWERVIRLHAGAAAEAHCPPASPATLYYFTTPGEPQTHA